MKIIMPDRIPVVSLLKFAASHGLEVRQFSGHDIEFQESSTTRVKCKPCSETRTVRNSAAAISNHPTFDGPSVA